MRKTIVLAPLLVLLAAATSHAQQCDQSLMRHVYHPDRLVTKKGCITVTGRITSRRQEKDGDIHVRLRLDPGQGADLINQTNVSAQGGDLVFEPVCTKAPTQADAKPACRNFRQHLRIPRNGTHVSITGVHVLDTDHGWLEIHPITSITVLH